MIIIDTLRKVLLILGLIIGSLACYVVAGPALALIWVVLWFDRVFIGYTRIAYDFGLELVTSSMILIGMIYGMSFSFLFGFFMYPVLDGFRWIVAPPFTPEWPPLMPSPDSVIAGATGVIAGLLIGYMPFFYVAFITLIVRIPVVVAKDWIFYEMPFRPGYIFTIPLSLLVISLLSFLIP